ncbi:SART-1 family protein DOT2 [Cinnamomum micranthum f. kanehirae]|uniref:SART-1 family protein DOT2 n=1 Tax=Cinnamomum micranthum f. kanehirae TaxID=337451 RepID=A0A443PW87_9MAGN|nr:SART-1 family protein DOT2 [Cinnamomum micranthum f. kanehirae]
MASSTSKGRSVHIPSIVWGILVELKEARHYACLNFDLINFDNLTWIKKTNDYTLVIKPTRCGHSCRQTSDPRSGFATVEKDHPGSLTPMLGDRKVEHFLGIKRKAEPSSMAPQKKQKE